MHRFRDINGNPKCVHLPPPPHPSNGSPPTCQDFWYVNTLTSPLNKFLKGSLSFLFTHSTPPFRLFIDWEPFRKIITVSISVQDDGSKV